jgi:cytochrome c oxidase subunit 2
MPSSLAQVQVYDAGVVARSSHRQTDTVTMRSRTHRERIALVSLAGWWLGAGPAFATNTPNVFSPASTPAEVIRALAWLVLAITVAIFVVVAGVLAFSIARYRARKSEADGEPPQIYGSSRIELAWTLVPVIIVFVLFLVTVRTMRTVQKTDAPPGSLQVTVVGHQWWWEFRYPEQGFVTANEMHVPVSTTSQLTPIFLSLESADVIHSFWVPRLAGKTDVIPGRVNHMWIEPTETGLFVGQCGEFCGVQHAGMLIRVIVESHEDFERWVAQQQQDAADDPQVAAGREAYRSLACVSCHTIRGAVPGGDIGPDLTHLMSRATLAGGVVPNTEERLREWLIDPAGIKPGARMPGMDLDGEELDAITSYLRTLR